MLQFERVASRVGARARANPDFKIKIHFSDSIRFKSFLCVVFPFSLRFIFGSLFIFVSNSNILKFAYVCKILCSVLFEVICKNSSCRCCCFCCCGGSESIPCREIFWWLHNMCNEKIDSRTTSRERGSRNARKAANKMCNNKRLKIIYIIFTSEQSFGFNTNLFKKKKQRNKTKFAHLFFLRLAEIYAIIVCGTYTKTLCS